MTGKIYIASSSAGSIPNAHTYLVFDEDGDTNTFDDQRMINAGLATNIPRLWGQVTVNFSSGTATDGSGGADTFSNFENIDGSDYSDTLTGNSSANTIVARSGDDTVYGGTNSDTFFFEADTAYASIDVVKNFSLTDNDKINIHDLLAEYDPLTELFTDFVEITTSGSDSILKVDRDGTGSTYSFTQIATLEGITGLTDESALKSSGNLVV